MNHFLAAALLCSPLPSEDSHYLVVLEKQLADSEYERAAEALAEHRDADLWFWNGRWEALERKLLQLEPRYLALVLAPGSIDANLPRRLVPLLARFDDDPFVDCAFGLITGATGEDALRFVENIIRAPEGSFPPVKFESTSVVVDECMRIGPRPFDRGVEREVRSTELWVTGRDPGWRAFLARHRGEASGSGLVEWGHCGDSQGIWLFSMYRNMDEEKHWEFSPDKVGHDPQGEMPRMTPMSLVEGVDLFPAVVVNGSCHSAVTRRTVVGPDIVSTFGDTGGLVRFYEIASEESFPLMAIRHGATAYIAPLAANNANRAAIEQWWILRGGTPLGEVMKRTYDELVLGAARPELAFALFEEGRREPREAPMFHDSFHRVLFGDPALVPWGDVVPTSHEVELERRGSRLTVRLHWKDLRGDPWVWDPWREERHPDGERSRVYERIPLEGDPKRVRGVQILEAQVLAEGAWKPVTLEPTALIEIGPSGESVLHLHAGAPREELNRYDEGAPTEVRARFEVTLVE